MGSYGTDIYGAQCGHNRGAVVRIHLRAVAAIRLQRERERNITLRCNMQLQCQIYKSVNSNLLNNPALIQSLFCTFSGII
jgi:hypothetical protein